MRTFTCEETLTYVIEARRPVASDAAQSLASHLARCEDCRTGILNCRRADSLMKVTQSRGLRRDDAVALAAHLVECDDCRAQAETTEQVSTVLEDVDMPEGLSLRLEDVTREHLSRQLRARAFETPLGWGALAYSDGGVLLVERYFRSPLQAYESLHDRLEDFIVQERRRDDPGESAARKLVEYHAGRRVRFDEPLDLSLVPSFTQDVLRATSRIPYGQVRPYAWVAREVGHPRAARAVGQALHINPVAPIIPCHRVIASDNTLGGYGGGLDVKRWLLRLEGYLGDT